MNYQDWFAILALIMILQWHTLSVHARDEYDEYSYEYEYQVSEDGDVKHETFETKPADSALAGALSAGREKQRKEERRKESMKMQQQLKEKHEALKQLEEERAAELAAKEAVAQERSEFVSSAGGIGYRKNVGRGLKRVINPFVNEQYLNTIASSFYCIPLGSWGVVKRNVTDHADEEARKQSEMKDQLSRLDGSFTAEEKENKESPQKAPEKIYDNPKVKAKPKKPTFRELQDKKMKERKEKEEKKVAQMGSFMIGASCEGLACASCRSLVEEFGDAVVLGASNPAFTYIEDVLPALCGRKEVKQRYTDIVGGMCDTIVSSRLGYREAFLVPFEHDEEWTHASMSKTISDKSKKVCTDIGACDSKHFEVRLSSTKTKEKHWDDKCFVCQAFAIELEERLQLRKQVSESDTGDIARNICDKLAFPEKLQPTCRELSPGKHHSDITWLAYMHAESIPRQKKAHRLFKDQLCEELKFCEPFIDEEEAALEEAKKVEPVFF